MNNKKMMWIGAVVIVLLAVAFFTWQIGYATVVCPPCPACP